MAYTLSLHVDENSNLKNYIKIIEDFFLIKNNKSIYVSDNEKEHPYSLSSPSKNGIYVSYSVIDRETMFFLSNILTKIANKIGLDIEIDGLKYKHFFYDDEVNLIIQDFNEYEKVILDLSEYYYFYEFKSIKEYEKRLNLIDKLFGVKGRIKKSIEYCNNVKI